VDDDGTRVRVVCGNFWGWPAGRRHRRGSDLGDVRAARQTQDAAGRPRHAFAYVFAGSGFSATRRTATVKTDGVGSGSGSAADASATARCLFDRGDEITVQAGEQGVRFLLVSGSRLKSSRVMRPDHDEHGGRLRLAVSSSGRALSSAAVNQARDIALAMVSNSRA
jgi:redox-sensitive bicupin YhaK (pirin superfamily)